jgi:protein disulfide-isomerase
MDKSEQKEVGFAWVDGVFWERWIRTTYGIEVAKDGEKVVINDEDVSSSITHATEQD